MEHCKYIRNKEIQPKAIVIAPLCYNSGKQVSETDTVSIIDLIEDVCKTYSVNRDKISIAGHSQGSRHALRIAKANPNYFSACVLFSWIPNSKSPNDMENLPAPTCQTKFIYENRSSANHYINRARNFASSYSNISVETVPNVNHETVVEAYKTTDIIQWMINQTR